MADHLRCACRLPVEEGPCYERATEHSPYCVACELSPVCRKARGEGYMGAAEILADYATNKAFPTTDGG